MKNRGIIYSIFGGSFALILVLLLISLINTNSYNNKLYNSLFESNKLFTETIDKTKNVSVNAVARNSTWGKIFDFNNEGITENNYQAHTYDFTIKNNTNDKVKNFKFKLTFSYQVFISSAWNGSIEFHQTVDGNEIVATIPDLRDYDPSNYSLKTVKVDGENLIELQKGDYIVYYPNSSVSAHEIPIRSKDTSIPGIILYFENGHDILNSSLEIEYTLFRIVTNDILFRISIVGFGFWAVLLIGFIIMSLQITKYKRLHERDNKIINESIETFTGFIDAKDPYTNGHSKRVAIYTKLIAKEMGFEGEELDRIYYIALLHDCGKIGVPDNILGKPGRLTDEEFKIIKSHTVRGGEILSSFKSLENAGEGALYHHERYDGKGYPEGLKGEDIPLIARMICVADSFDAMNSNRVYRNKLSVDYILDELKNNAGTQFDPKIADVLLKLIKEGKINMDDKLLSDENDN